MHRQSLLVLVLLGLGIPALGDFKTIAETYEVVLNDLRLPGSEYGTLSFKRCADCESQTLRVTGNTRYLVNNRVFAMAEFKEQYKLVASRKDSSVNVVHHLESDTITEIKLWLR